LKSKYEVFVKFKEFKSLIENITERKIKILRSDNGGEYTSKEFVRFCKDAKMKRELTCHTPTTGAKIFFLLFLSSSLSRDRVPKFL
jgi:hypothetical protein